MSEPVPAPPPPPAPAPASPRSAPLRGLLGDFSLDVVVGVVALFGTSFAVMVAWGIWRAVAQAQGLDGGSDGPGAAVLMLAAILGMSSAAILLYFWRRPASAAERRQSFAAAARPRTWLLAAGAGVAVFACSSLAGWVMSAAGIDPVPSNMVLIEEAARRWPVFLVLFAVFLAPAYEELLFRRVLLGRFLDAGRPWLGLVLSSVAFALAHEVPGLSANPPGAVAVLLAVYASMGAIFGWVYWRTGSLWAAIGAHALNNGLALLVHGLGSGST